MGVVRRIVGAVRTYLFGGGGCAVCGGWVHGESKKARRACGLPGFSRAYGRFVTGAGPGRWAR